MAKKLKKKGPVRATKTKRTKKAKAAKPVKKSQKLKKTPKKTTSKVLKTTKTAKTSKAVSKPAKVAKPVKVAKPAKIAKPKIAKKKAFSAPVLRRDLKKTAEGIAEALIRSVKRTKEGSNKFKHLISTKGFEKTVSELSKGQVEEAKIGGSKFDIGVPHNAHALALQEIPLEYGKNQITVLVVDPHFVFAYWEVKQDTIIETVRHLGDNSKLTLRFYDVTDGNDPENSPSWDVEVFDRLGNWYLRLARPEQKLCLDIGMKGRSGEFHRFARSNMLRLPPVSLARPGPIRWMVVTPSGDKLISDIEEYTDADLELLKKILGPYFYDLLMRGRFATLSGSSVEAVFFDVESLRAGESPSKGSPWPN